MSLRPRPAAVSSPGACDRADAIRSQAPGDDTATSPPSEPPVAAEVRPPDRFWHWVALLVASVSIVIAAVACLYITSGGPDANQPYDPAWAFPARTDPVVVSLPAVHPAGRHDEAHKLDEYIAHLPDTGGVVVRPDELPDEQRKKLAAVLETLFGTPAAPVINGETRFRLEPDDLKAGAKRYKTACANCHGMTGDGRGTAGLWAFPHPRDFRSGKSKRATGAGANAGRPRLSDLVEVIQKGVPGTTMGATGLPREEAKPLAVYTMFLSIRGEVELELLKAMADPEGDPANLEAEGFKQLDRVLKLWARADSEKPVPHAVQPRPDDVTAEYAESIRRGQKLFVSQTAGCTSCHTDYGRTPTFRYDVWGVPNRVRDLTDKPRHWAREPNELAAQLVNGIPAANMPGNPLLTAGEIADLVHFTRELPYPQRLPDDVRRAVR